MSTSGTHKVKTLLGSGWRSIRSGASSLCRKNPPPLSLPVICACGPRNVYGPAIRVENTDIHGWKVDPHGEGAGFGVGLGSLEGSHKQHYQLDEAPRIAVNPLGDRAEVRAEKARVGAACLPDFFHVGFVVRSEHDMMIEVVRSPKSSLAGHLSVQKSRPHVLQDTTGDGTHPLTLTCRAIDRCPHGGGRNCKEFYPSHMTEASWKEKLAFMIQSWDYGQNDAVSFGYRYDGKLIGAGLVSGDRIVMATTVIASRSRAPLHCDPSYVSDHSSPLTYNHKDANS